MKELKTLKDLQLGYEGYPPEDERIREQLKAEAVKWAKDLKFQINLCDCPSDCHGCLVLQGGIDILKVIFNITEEDLKEQKQK